MNNPLQGHSNSTQNIGSVASSFNTGHLRIRQKHYDYFQTPDAPSNQLILYLNGDPEITNVNHDQQLAFTARLSQISNRRVLPIHPFSNPTHPFPNALMNVEAIYTGLFSEGFRADNIILGADSTAGGLAVALMLLLKEKNILGPKGIFLFSPFLDLTLSSLSLDSKAHLDTVLSKDKLLQWAMRYYGGNDPRNPLVSPMLGVFRNFPPLLVQVGKDEILLNDSETFGQKVKTAGVSIQLKILEHKSHTWYIHLEDVDVGKALYEVGMFIHNNLPIKPIKKIYGPEDFL